LTDTPKWHTRFKKDISCIIFPYLTTNKNLCKFIKQELPFLFFRSVYLILHKLQYDFARD